MNLGGDATDGGSDAGDSDPSDGGGDGDSLASGTGTCLDEREPVDADHVAMFTQLNDYRVANGLEPLTYSWTLQEAADDYAARMAAEDFFNHVAPDGNEPSDRAVAAGFCHPYVGENIAYGMNQLSLAAEAMAGFRNSPGHDANMLYPQWEHVGIGVMHVSGPQGNEYWWVQLFAMDADL